MWLNSLLLVTANLAAATSPVPKLYRAYFIAELIGNTALVVTPWAYDSDAYRALWVTVLLPVRGIALWAGLRGLGSFGSCIGLGMLVIALKCVGHPSLDQWLCIVDGTLVSAAGYGLAINTKAGPSMNLTATLSFLWILLGLLDFGIAIQPFSYWNNIQEALLPLAVSSAFMWIAWQQWLGHGYLNRVRRGQFGVK